MAEALVIRPFAPADQEAARSLVLRGLAERWGWLDESKNADLDNIAATYADGVFLVARLGEELVGTGALLAEGREIGRVVRMSVARKQRRQGVGRRLLQALLAAARARGYRRVVLETTATWQDAVAFYSEQGFRPVAVRNGEMHFAYDLQ
jgi:GNAT superfamily N-acetyltransferase